jgi:hypothetical protein
LCGFGTWRLRCIRRDERRIAGEAILGKSDVALRGKESGLYLAIATATRPAGPFIDIAKLLPCGDGFINIDPIGRDGSVKSILEKDATSSG